MKRILFALVFAVFTAGQAASAAEAVSLKLPAPQTDKGRPLMQVLKDRKTVREFSAEDLPPATLSDLLWAAFGVNRPNSGKRTAPSAMDMREIDVYVARSDGLYVYDATAGELVSVLKKDIRAATGKQAFVRDAPLDLVFVADLAKMQSVPAGDRDFYAALDTGYISENVYLYCASAGLATVARGWFDRDELEKAMRLRSNQKVILTQTVGYPKG